MVELSHVNGTAINAVCVFHTRIDLPKTENLPISCGLFLSVAAANNYFHH